MKPRFSNLPKALADERKVLLILRQMGVGKAAVQPSPSALQYFRAATAAIAAGEHKKAVAQCAAALDQSPCFAQAYAVLGLALGQLGHRRAEIICCKAAIQLLPSFAEAHFALAGALDATGQHEEAIEAVRAALALKPDNPPAQALLNRLLLVHGVTLQNAGRIDEAADRYREAIAIDPANPDSHRNLGAALQTAGRFEEAKAAYRTALALNPKDADAWGYLGATLMEAGELAPADEAYTTALSLAPDDADIHFNSGLFLLKAGRLGEGWAEHEWRWRGIMPPHGIAAPQWQGEPAEGKRILLHWEQGFGDTLQFVRYAPLVAERGLKVVLEVQKPLVRLMRGMPGIETVLAPGEPRPPFDLHCPLLSLPFAFGTEIETIPANIPYLMPPEELAADWQMRVGTGDGFKVGLVWAGKSVAGEIRAVYTDKRRSMDLAELAPLAAIPGIRWFNLQRDGVWDGFAFAMTDLMPETTDFADTAALIACLDLVITVDTAVAHLAGALGKPVWMLSRFDGCWRWLQGRDESPWYPTMRLYRQTAPGDWGPVVARLAEDLAKLAAV
jgi:tetratricopeptide (TPR) repeat protein